MAAPGREREARPAGQRLGLPTSVRRVVGPIIGELRLAATVEHRRRERRRSTKAVDEWSPDRSDFLDMTLLRKSSQHVRGHPTPAEVFMVQQGERYRRLRGLGVLPYRAMDHGSSTSLY